MFQKILVPLDGSDLSAAALAIAVSYLKDRELDGELYLVMVAEPLPEAYGAYPIDPDFDEAVKQGYRRYLDGIAAEIAVSGIRVNAEVVSGSIIDRLVDAVIAHGVELIMMTSHGLGGVSRFWLGSTAARLIRSSPVPLLLLRAGADGAVPPLAPKKVLLPLDGTGFGEEIIAHAISLAGLTSAEFHLVEVVKEIPKVLSGASLDHDLRVLREREAHAESYLRELKTQVRGQGGRCHTHVLRAASVAQRLIEFSQLTGVDLIALSSHGRGGMGRLLMGSVADKLIRGTELPLLLNGPVNN